jgi:NAD(P)-dependent dehydrogenase (short-subunit alcohol dehydrogenase family)
MPGDGVTVVTGAASGMGSAIARLLVSRGQSVILADIQDAEGRALAAELGASAVFQHTDVTVESDIEAVIGFAASEWPQLDGMVNNAGIIGATGPIDEIDVQEWDFTIAVLLRSVFLGTKHAARVMKPQRRGAIVNTASIAALRGGIGPHAYAAAKAGVVALTRNSAAELGAYGIRVNAVAPGRIATPMVADTWAGDHRDIDGARAAILSESPLEGRAGSAEDIAQAAVWLLSEAAGYVSGQVLCVDGGVIGGSSPAGSSSAAATSQRYAGKHEFIREAGQRGLPQRN